MKYYLQTLNPDLFMEVNQAVSLAGIWTEPADFSRNEIDVMNAVENLLEVMSEDQKMFVGGIASGFRSMLEEGKKLQKLSAQLVLTLPCAEQGLMAVKAARRLSLPIAMGSLFTLAQASFAWHNDAAWLVIDMEKAGRFTDSVRLLKDILALAGEEERERIIVLCPTSEILNQALRCQAQAVAAPAEVYTDILFNVLTSSETAQTREEWLLAYTRTEFLD